MLFDSENKVAAVIVTYNPEIGSLASLIKAISLQVAEVIVVDNNSDNVYEYSSKIEVSSNVIIIKLHENKGLSTAQNLGIKNASDDVKFFLLFDQDSMVESDFVCKQLNCYKKLIDEGKKVAAVGPTFVDRVSKYKYPATIYKGPFLKRVEVCDIPTESTFIIASGSLIPKDILETVGLMLDDFFIDFVDVEWCLRARKYGFLSYINPSSTMQHSIGDLRIVLFGRMISLHSDFRKFYIYRNGIFMTRLNYIPLGYKIRVVVFNLIRTFLGIAVSKNKMKSLKASSKGWFHGFKGFNKISGWK
uniref:glycosyltransferase family 2 protein n=1 Tax=Pluralibacter gergoviae TaxID=61647 RepID=UPI0009BF31EB|nr:glycosyltransferase family 2 protein [Pluralibacter gergoviae]